MRDYVKNPVLPTELMAGKFKSLRHLREIHPQKGVWFGDLRQLEEHPRICAMHVTWQRNAQHPETVWFVDGDRIASIEAVCLYLDAHPLPEASPVDLALMLTVFQPDWREVDDWVEVPADLDIKHFERLTDRAMVETRRQNGGLPLEVKLTEVGTAVLTERYGAGV